MNTKRAAPNASRETQSGSPRKHTNQVLPEGIQYSEKRFNMLGERLILAALNGKKESVARILRAGVDADYYGKEERLSDAHGFGTALLAAATRGRTEVAKLLIQNGADLNARCPIYRATPLMHACIGEETEYHEGRKEVIKLLLENGANIDEQDPSGATALMWATVHGTDSIVKLLLENGANPNIINENGKTALKCAKEEGKASTIALLKEYM
jgi:ankyrin repeat protein